MKFHKYLEQVLGNKLVIRVLRTVLDYRGKIFTVRSLAKTAHVSHNETALIVGDLEKLGIIRIQPVGRAYQLQLNEKNYILDKIIEPAFRAEKNTIEELLRILKKHFSSKKIISIAIFGSVAKGEEKEDSDIDLLIISDDFDYASTIVSNVEEEVSLIFHSKISPVIFSEKELRAKKNSTLLSSIKSNHIMVYGKDIGKL